MDEADRHCGSKGILISMHTYVLARALSNTMVLPGVSELPLSLPTHPQLADIILVTITYCKVGLESISKLLEE